MTKKIKILGRIPNNLKNRILNIRKDDFSLNESIGFWVDYSNFSIPLGSTFNSVEHNNIFFNINASLKFVTDNSFLEMEGIEEGYKTIAFIFFKDDLNILTEIPIIQSWYDNSKNSFDTFFYKTMDLIN